MEQIEMLLDCKIRVPMIGSRYTKKQEKDFVRELKAFLKEHHARVSIDGIYES